jgi:hypothetical protein
MKLFIKQTINKEYERTINGRDGQILGGSSKSQQELSAEAALRRRESEAMYRKCVILLSETKVGSLLEVRRFLSLRLWNMIYASQTLCRQDLICPLRAWWQWLSQESQLLAVFSRKSC